MLFNNYKGDNIEFKYINTIIKVMLSDLVVLYSFKVFYNIKNNYKRDR